ncbi:MAG: TrmB family transcriptional regulator [Rubrobacteraceae bacterium]
MNPGLLRVVQELGFTEYEAKAYLALLDQSPLSGYKVAQSSGVPRSKIYEVLGGLVRRGAVLVNHGEPVRYAPLPPKELISRRRREMEESLTTAEESLGRYAESQDSRGVIWDIKGREEILERVREVVGRAERSVLVEIWEEDAPELREPLSAAAGRGIEVGVVAYGEPDYPFARVYYHDLVDEITRGLGARWIVLSADMREVVTGILSLGENSRAAWTTHPGLVVPTTEVIKHDIYIQELLEEHREILEESFGPSLINLRERLRRLEAMGAPAGFP